MQRELLRPRIMAMRKSFAVLIIALTAGNASAKDASPAVSLLYSCSDKLFLSVSVATFDRRHFPDVRFKLTDPAGKALGSGVKRKLFPKARYGRVIGIRSNPARSKAIAAEICGAMQGDYEVNLSEQGSEKYRLAVQADEGSHDSDSMESIFMPREGRTCTVKFRVRMIEPHIVNVHWLRSADNVQTSEPDPACELATPR
jgi:hypothetical protein